MENAGQVPAPIGIRREPSTDPVKAQGILNAVTRKSKQAARLWPQHWSFYCNLREIQEEEAQKLGFKLDEYRAGLRSVSSQPEKDACPVTIDPSPTGLPSTSTGMIGYRSKCALERYGRLVMTSRDYPAHPPLPPGQIYDPYKQTIIFLGGGAGDPISYKLPPARSEVTHEMWARPQQLSVTPFDLDTNAALQAESRDIYMSSYSD